jgi:hypothetical protein
MVFLCGELNVYTRRHTNYAFVVCTPISVKIFVTISTEQYLDYFCKALFETSCIKSRSHIEL